MLSTCQKLYSLELLQELYSLTLLMIKVTDAMGISFSLTKIKYILCCFPLSDQMSWNITSLSLLLGSLVLLTHTLDRNSLKECPVISSFNALGWRQGTESWSNIFNSQDKSGHREMRWSKNSISRIICSSPCYSSLLQ